MNASVWMKRMLFSCLMIVSSIAGVAGAAPDRSSETLTIIDRDGTKIALTEDDLRKMPAASEDQFICVGKSSGFIGIYDFKGVRLSEVLKKAAATASAKEYIQENTYVVFKGADGYQVSASWTELMVNPEGLRGMVVLDKDGKPLPALEGQFRLLLPGDKYVGRSVKCLETIEIHTVEGFVDFPKKEEIIEGLEKPREETRLE